MTKVYVSIGSNIDREQNVRGAVAALSRKFGRVETSRVYQTAAEGFEGDDFYNLVAAFDTEEPVEQVARALADIETAHGRRRDGAPRFSSRTLDLDILLYGDLVRHEGRLDIPRGEIKEHAYVLGPLAELAPNRHHPETGLTLAQMWENFDRGRPTMRPVAMKLID